MSWINLPQMKITNAIRLYLGVSLLEALASLQPMLEP
jgi:hypothetical protein